MKNANETVYWLVAYRVVMHYGSPERIVNVREILETQTERYDSSHVFTNYDDACEKADSYRYQRDANGTLVSKSSPDKAWPPNRVW